MTRRTLDELNAADAAKIERRRRMLARAKDPIIGELESLATQLDGYATIGRQEGEDMDVLVAAASTLRGWADKCAAKAVPK